MLHGVTVIVPGVPHSYHLDFESYPLATAHNLIIFIDSNGEDCEIDQLEPEGSTKYPVTDKDRHAHRKLMQNSTRSIAVAHDFVANLELKMKQQVASTATFAPKISKLVSATPIFVIMPEDPGDHSQKTGSGLSAIKENFKAVKAELHKSKKMIIR